MRAMANDAIHRKLLALSVVSLVALMGVGFCFADLREQKFQITTRRMDDTVKISTERNAVFFTVKSPFGISHAVIERQADDWPEIVELRLHLKGLESFRISNGKVTLNAAVQTVGEQSGRVRVWKDADETAGLTDDSPFWFEPRPLGDDGKPATKLPLESGYFQIRVPKAFFENNPKSVTVTWIDFFR